VTSTTARRTMNIHRKVAAAASAGLLSVALLGASATSALAAPCYGATCTGKSPTIGCNADATSLIVKDYTAEDSAHFRVEVRYSRACNAAWGRLTVWSGNIVGFALSAWNPGAPSQGLDGPGTSWTRMIDGGPQDCAGTQFYVNGNWVRWYYIGCA
jgi:Protein of unknown function (DUF2690)